MIYRLDVEARKLIPHEPPWVQVRPGAGPRYFAWHPNGRHAYVTNELYWTFSAFDYDETAGTLTESQSVSMLPQDFEGYNTCADLHVSPSAKFLYGSNRGHDSIVTFAIDRWTGRLTPTGHTVEVPQPVSLKAVAFH